MRCGPLKYLLHQPVVDLVESDCAEFFSNAAAWSAQHLGQQGAAYPIWIQRRNPPGFRAEVMHELDPAIGVGEKLPSAEEQPGGAWETMRLHVIRWNNLDSQAKLKTARVLLQLGEYRLTARLLDHDPSSEHDPQLTLLRLTVEVGLFRSGRIETLDAASAFDTCNRIADDAQLPWTTRTASAISAFLLSVNGPDPVHRARAPYERLRSFDRALESEGHHFIPVSLRSRILRAAAMYPHLTGDLPLMRYQMETAERLGLDAPAVSPTEALLARENLFSVYESRVKEAFALQDMDAARRFGDKLIALFPLNAAARILFGEVLMKLDEFPAAAAQYQLAAAFSPPGGALAWFMAGECFALAGQEDRAVACYLQSLRLDPFAIAAARKTMERTRASTQPQVVRSWSEAIYQTLNEGVEP